MSGHCGASDKKMDSHPKQEMLELWTDKWQRFTFEILRSLGFTQDLALVVLRCAAPCWGHSMYPKHFKLHPGNAHKIARSEASIFLNEPLNQGVWEVTVKLDALGDPASDSSDSETDMWTHVGFSPRFNLLSPTASPEVIGWSRGSYSMFQNGDFFHNRMVISSASHGVSTNRSEYVLPGYTRGDSVTARIDFDRDEISFAVNNRWKAPIRGFKRDTWIGNSNDKLWFGVTLQEPGQQATLVRLLRSRNAGDNVMSNFTNEGSFDVCSPMRCWRN
ncbi:hypothetical protein AAMO2058_000557200 [Amorphochlora amoebiformis]